VRSCILRECVKDLAKAAQDQNVSSLQDLRALALSFMKERFDSESIPNIDSDCIELANRVTQFLNSKKVNDLDAIRQKLLNIDLNKETMPTPVWTYKKDNENFLHIGLPLPQSETGETEVSTTALIIKFASLMTCIPVKRITVSYNGAYGTGIILPDKAQDLIRRLNVSADSTSLATRTYEHQFSGNRRLSVEEMLVGIKTIHKYRPNLKKSKVVDPLTSSKLIEAINKSCSINSKGMGTYFSRLIRCIFAEACSPANNGIPKHYYSLFKDKAKVKTSKGILAYLGLTPVIPSAEKLIFCLNHEVVKKNNRFQLLAVEEPSPDESRAKTFQAGMKLLLPSVRVKHTSESVRDQISKDTMKHGNPSARNLYKEHPSLDNYVNLTYAIGSALIHKKKGKATPQQFENARNNLLKAARSSRVPIKDGDGRIYDHISTVPEHVQVQVAKLLKFQRMENKKRRAEILLAKAEKRLRSITDLSQEAMFTINSDKEEASYHSYLVALERAKALDVPVQQEILGLPKESDDDMKE
jgi:hypothetical protein